LLGQLAGACIECAIPKGGPSTAPQLPGTAQGNGPGVATGVGKASGGQGPPTRLTNTPPPNPPTLQPQTPDDARAIGE
jgi:hypothetical protein